MLPQPFLHSTPRASARRVIGDGPQDAKSTLALPDRASLAFGSASAQVILGRTQPSKKDKKTATATQDALRRVVKMPMSGP